MAYTIKSQPTTPNCTYTDLVYNVSSSNAGNPQFNYIMDVYISGSATRLARIRQFPNPSLEAVFDPSRIFNDNLTYDTENLLVADLVENATLPVDQTSKCKDFQVEFGEEYGTSPSSSLTVYPNQANDFITAFTCQVDPNNGTGYNFVGGLVTPGSGSILSDRPNDVDDFEGGQFKMSFFNNTGGTLFTTASYSIQGTDYEDVQAGKIVSIANVFTPQAGETLTITFNGESITRTFQPICEYPAYNFMFINKYGMWENFSTALPVRGNVSLDKQNYEQTFVDYAGTGAYDLKRRGETNYSTGVTENLTISSNWLSKEAAQWLTQLIESDEVYLAVSPNNTVFKPIVITNASYVQNTGRKDQKTFMYDITFRYSNQRPGR